METLESRLNKQLNAIAENLPQLRAEEIGDLLIGVASEYRRKANTTSFPKSSFAVPKEIGASLEKAFHDRPPFFLTDVQRDLVPAIKDNHEPTYKHCLRVGVSAAKFGAFLGLNTSACMSLLVAGIIHDIGKSRIDRKILESSTAPSPADIESLKSHAGVSQLMLSRYKDTDIGVIMRETALYHHERMDGGGYPEGKKGGDIPFAARLVSICDTFDAMTDPTRKYQTALSAEKALLRMVSKETASLSAGPIRDAYDPKLLAAFISMKMQEPGMQLSHDAQNTLRSFVKEVFYPGISPDLEISGRPVQPRPLVQAPRA